MDVTTSERAQGRGAALPRVRIEGVAHRYGKVIALDDVTIDIGAGELLTLLGPSGCGKTTLLRIIAGFERPAAGRVLLAGEDVTGVPPHKRATNMVFQRPTLFPHLNVEANVEFGLQVAGVDRGERRRRVAEALALVRLEGFERRRSHELSGGQMQRVALARALVNRPSVLLLDEPLSALDLKVRLEMEVELRRVHRETGATFVYVTHDQGEAMALSDRLVVMNEGRVEQIGAPDEVYRRPASPFAAGFVGDANVVPVEVVSARDGEAEVALGPFRRWVACDPGTPLGPAWLVLRPEVLRIRAPSGDASAVRAVVRDVAFRGTRVSYRVDVDGLSQRLKAESAEGGAMVPELDTPVELEWSPSACCLLPRAT